MSDPELLSTVDNILLLKGIPHQQVKVSPVLPRLALSEYLGVTYRRIPVLAIGNDLYCDTNLIASTLERRFPPEKNYLSLFPPRKGGGSSDTGLAKALSRFYVDGALFPPTTGLLPWNKFDAAFIKDRSAFRGAPIDPEALSARRPLAESALAGHLLFIEEQLSDSREWLLDTKTPSLVDISIHFALAWAKNLSKQGILHDEGQYPLTMQWLRRTSRFFDQKRQISGLPIQLEPAMAGDIITSSSHEPLDIVGFDTNEATRLGIKLRDTVQVAPEDSGRNFPTTGQVCALSSEQIVLVVSGSKGSVHLHFPRLGYFVKLVPQNKL